VSGGQKETLGHKVREESPGCLGPKEMAVCRAWTHVRVFPGCQELRGALGKLEKKGSSACRDFLVYLECLGPKVLEARRAAQETMDSWEPWALPGKREREESLGRWGRSDQSVDLVK